MLVPDLLIRSEILSGCGIIDLGKTTPSSVSRTFFSMEIQVFPCIGRFESENLILCEMRDTAVMMRWTIYTNLKDVSRSEKQSKQTSLC